MDSGPVLALYAALADRDLAAVEALLSPRVRWHVPRANMVFRRELPRARVVSYFAERPSGHQSARTTLSAVTSTPSAVLVRGEHELHLHGRRRQSISFDHAWRVEDGRVRSLVEVSTAPRPAARRSLVPPLIDGARWRVMTALRPTWHSDSALTVSQIARRAEASEDEVRSALAWLVGGQAGWVQGAVRGRGSRVWWLTSDGRRALHLTLEF